MNNKENTQHIAQLKDNTIDVTQIIGQVYDCLLYTSDAADE